MIPGLNLKTSGPVAHLRPLVPDRDRQSMGNRILSRYKPFAMVTN